MQRKNGGKVKAEEESSQLYIYKRKIKQLGQL
jgi:hypothetical protein